MKNPIRRKALSVLLAFSMMLSVFQFAGIPVFAEEGTGVTAYYCDSGLFKDSQYTRVVSSKSTITNIEIKEGTKVIGVGAFIGCSALTNIVIPNSVTSIDDEAFGYCTGLTAVTIPKNVMVLGESVFNGCTGLTKIKVDENSSKYCDEDGVLFTKDKTELITYPAGMEDGIYTIPDTVTTVRDSAFKDCSGLCGVVIPDSMKTIGANAFKSCQNLYNPLFIPAGVTTIGEGAFAECNKLTDATFESAEVPKVIGSGLFDSCANGFTLWVPNQAAVTAYQNSSSLSCYNIKAPEAADAGTLFNCGGINYQVISAESKAAEIVGHWGKCRGNFLLPGKAALKGNVFRVTAISAYSFQGTSVTSVTIPVDVMEVGESVFASCGKLTDVLFAEGSKLTAIGNNAFGGCANLTTVTIPKNVTAIGESVFSGCTGLTKIEVDENNSKYCDEDGVLLTKDKTILLFYPQGVENSGYTISNTVKVIGSGAFDECSSLKNIIIPAGVTTIGEEAFEECENLTDVIFEGSSKLTTIGNEAFFCCFGLKDFILPESVTAIGNNAFQECFGLTDIIIPAGVTKIGEGAFASCHSLTDVTFESKVPPSTVGNLAFERCAENLTGWVPDEASVSAYQACDNLSYNINQIKAAEPVGTGTKFTSGGIRCKVTSANSRTAEVTSNSSSPYTGNINIPEKAAYRGNVFDITAIEDSAFADCSGLTGIGIPVNITAIGKSAFASCAMLTEIRVDKSNGKYCSVDNVLFSKDKTTLAAYPAGKKDAGYTIPDTVTGIRAGAFYNCTDLTEITIPESIATIGEEAFKGCSLTKATLKGKVTSIEADAFNQGESTSLTFAVPNGAVNYYKNLLNPTVMGKTSAVVSGTKIVTAITGLPPAKNVVSGTSLKDLALPASLILTADGAQETLDVSWTSSPEYDTNHAGTYIFTFILPGSYMLGDGVSTSVTVRVASSNSPSSSGGSSGTNFKLTVPTTVTSASSGMIVDLSGATMPAGVTGVTLSATHPAQGSAPDVQASNALRIAVSDARLNVIGTPVVYDLKLLDQSGNPLTGFGGRVTVRLPLPPGLRGTPHVLRYEETAGTFTDMNATVQNGYLVFFTDHFSYYAVAGIGDSITLDTKSYRMPSDGSYQIGMKLTGTEAASVKFYSSNNKIATVAKLKNGNYRVTGKDTGTAYIMFDVYDNKNRLLTHASVRIDVKAGSRPGGDSTRQIGIF